MDYDETSTYSKKVIQLGKTEPMPAVLVAHCPDGAQSSFRCDIETSITIGREDKCDLTIADDNISRKHARITRDGSSYKIEDLGSKNGTYFHGMSVTRPENLHDQAVIRVGNSTLVFHRDAVDLNASDETDNYSIAGRFHGPKLVDKLDTCTMSGRNLLLAGPTGTGKELAAHAFAKMMGKKLTIQNAAAYTSEEEAVSTLFGVGKKVFSSVDPRRGCIERADKGILFLDEAHMLTRRVQKSLLRVIEDWRLTPIGKTQPMHIDVQFLFASNEPVPTFGLERDLLARLRVVALAPLSERLADIPTIFDHLLTKALKEKDQKAEPIMELLTAEHYQKLMLHGFKRDNVRGLIDITDRITSDIAMGSDPQQVIAKIFTERLGVKYSSLGTSFETSDEESITENLDPEEIADKDFNKLVEEAYQRHGGNVSAIERELRKKEIKSSRRKIAKVLDKVGFWRVKKPRKTNKR
ncbi:MAG: FHA domain-containing protein [Proteobacteria bacterium]|nr:FHA domain-containing protein [Pseudomonadota bacterium]